MPKKFSEIVSFDGGFRVMTSLRAPDKYRHLKSGLIDANLIPRGSGLSYAPASFGADSISISTQNFNRILGFDEQKKQVEVEAGISLGELFNFLIGRQSYLKIQPGCSHISVGGCIAADVHGKNPSLDGTFLNQIVSLKLFHPNHGVVEASREFNSDLFYLTCGGYGLTGIILSAVLQASKLTSSTVCTELILFEKLDDGVGLIGKLSPENDFVYSWNDLIPGLHPGGSGIIFKGNIEKDYKFDNAREIFRDINPDRKPHLMGNIFKSFSPMALNFLYKKINSRYSFVKESIFDSLYAAEKNFFYYRMHGYIGLHEYQAILPVDKIHEYHHAAIELSRRYKIPITLAAMKCFNGGRSLLRFDGQGVSFTINIPRRQDSSRMLSELDAVLVSLNGWPNLIKDSRISRSMVEATYPQYSLFKKKLVEFDAKRIFKSELSDRLGL